MVYYDKALHQVLFQCHKVCHSMYLTNHRIDVDICVVAITTASVHRQLKLRVGKLRSGTFDGTWAEVPRKFCA